MKGKLAAAWGITGVIAVTVDAMVRVLPLGLDAFSYPLRWFHWAALGLWLLLMAWLEGYRGFHCAFAPMVAARARYLRLHPKTLHVVLAPIFCFGLLHATRRRKLRSAALSIGIIAVIVLVRRLAQPWRGIVDLGVVLGLAIGLYSLVYFAAKAFGSGPFEHSPEVPGGSLDRAPLETRAIRGGGVRSPGSPDATTPRIGDPPAEDRTPIPR